MRRSHLISPLGLVSVFVVSGCASVTPFSTASPAHDTMAEEESYFFSAPSEASQGLAGTPLRARIDNTIAVYETELARARAAQGGFLNTTLNVLGVLLPISGTASALALSDPDQVQTVAVVAGAATTAVLGLNLLLKPAAKAASAAQCEAFLTAALESYASRWGSSRDAVRGSEDEWNTYLTMRATLEPGREAACEG